MTTQQDGQYDSSVDIACSGTISVVEGTTFLDFETETNNTKMRIGISCDVISVSRFGEQIYTMLLQKDNKTHFSILSKYGKIPVTIITHDIQYTQSSTELNLILDYTLQFVGDIPSHNKLEIKCIRH